jgi:hypothetical protein
VDRAAQQAFETELDQLSYVDPIAGDATEIAHDLIDRTELSDSPEGKAGEALRQKDWGTAANLLGTAERRSADEENDLGVALAHLALQGDEEAWREALEALKRSAKAAQRGKADEDGRRFERAQRNVLLTERARAVLG